MYIYYVHTCRARNHSDSLGVKGTSFRVIGEQWQLIEDEVEEEEIVDR